MERAHNFCAGPCTLPAEVIAELAAELPNLDDSGMSIIEMSHRSKAYDAVHNQTIESLRRLAAVPDDFSILLLQGGATLQFAMAPMNLLVDSATTAGYVVGGSWGKKAFADAKRVGSAYESWSGATDGFTSLPTVDEISVEDGSRYLHITSNETIGGIRFNDFFDPGIPMVADMSSDYLSRPIPWERFDLVYGGAQKNLGPAGLTVAFVRNSALETMRGDLPDYLRYGYHVDGNSMGNTPPVFSIWATGKMLRWMEANGGIPAMEKRAAERSSMIYDAIDNSGGFYTNPVDPTYRSHTNVVFRIADNDLEPEFLNQAETRGLMNLKGHRSVGGMRASIYNALPTESVAALVDFMSAFAAGHG